jgi:hypothetical protein
VLHKVYLSSDIDKTSRKRMDRTGPDEMRNAYKIMVENLKGHFADLSVDYGIIQK